MVEVQLVKSTEVIKTFKVEQNPENFKTTFSVSCEWMDREDYHNAQYELEQLGRDIKDLIFAHRNHPSALEAPATLNLENPTFSMMEPTSDPIPLGCWSNESLLKVATGKVVSLEYSQLDAAGELVFRLNSSMPEGVELRFATDTFPNPALDAPAERAAEGSSNKLKTLGSTEECSKLVSLSELEVPMKKQSEGMTKRLVERYGEDIFKDAKKSLSIEFTYEDYGRPRVQGESVGAIIAESRYPAVGSETHSGRSLICRDLIHIEHQSPLKDVEQLKEKIWQQARMIIDQLISDS